MAGTSRALSMRTGKCIDEMILELAWVGALAASSLSLSGYILYMKRVAHQRPWNVEFNSEYEPAISVLVPTFNEEATVLKKLENILDVDYPKEKMELILIDGASDDETVQLVKKWSDEHSAIKTRIITQQRRSGMVDALNCGLKQAHGEIVVKTDSDCLWRRDSLRNAIKYMADSRVGAVAGLHVIEVAKETHAVKTERVYRDFYRTLRIGESKLQSTVLYEGELMLVRRSLLASVGFDEDIGADDIPVALRITDMGYRAISAEDAFFIEQTPYTWKGKLIQKTRRGRHVAQALWKYRYMMFKRGDVFHRLILPFESYIYLVNPFVTVLFLSLSLGMILRYPWLLIFGTIFVVRGIRDLASTHLVNNLIMVLAVMMELRNRQKVTWEKIGEIRRDIPMPRSERKGPAAAALSAEIIADA